MGAPDSLVRHTLQRVVLTASRCSNGAPNSEKCSGQSGARAKNRLDELVALGFLTVRGRTGQSSAPKTTKPISFPLVFLT
jgi:hypothetical protein